MSRMGLERFVGLLLAVLTCVAVGDVRAQPVLYGLTGDGVVYLSDDVAVTWSAQATLGTSTAVGLVAGPGDGQRVLVTRDGVAWRSGGGGTGPWTAVGALAVSDVVDLTITRSGRLIACTRTGTVYASDDAGTTWTAIASLPASDVVSITATPDDTVLVLTRTGIVWRQHPDEAFAAVGALPFYDAVAIRARFDRVLVLDGTGFVAHSSDGGVGWQVASTLSQVGSVALCATNGGWAAATATGDVATSIDGTDWTWVGTLSQSGLVGLASGWSLVTSVESDPARDASLRVVAFPNPAPSGATVFLRMESGFTSSAWLQVFDARGRRVAADRIDPRGAGAGRLSWSAGDLASGVYHLRLKTPSGKTGSVRWVVVE